MRLALVTMLLVPAPVRADSPIAEVICAPRAQMVQRMTVQYRSSLTGMGVRDRETVMEVWSAADGRWTLVQRHADGLSCIVAMGADWIAVGGAS